MCRARRGGSVLTLGRGTASVMASSPTSSSKFLIRIERSATSRSVSNVSIIRGKKLAGLGSLGDLRHTNAHLLTIVARKLDLLSGSHCDNCLSEVRLFWWFRCS